MPLSPNQFAALGHTVWQPRFCVKPDRIHRKRNFYWRILERGIGRIDENRGLFVVMFPQTRISAPARTGQRRRVLAGLSLRAKPNCFLGQKCGDRVIEFLH